MNCLFCKKEFISKKENRKYCSKQCKIDSQKNNGTYKINLPIEEIKKLYLEEKNLLLRSVKESKSLYLLRNPEKNPFKRQEVIEKIRPFLSKVENIEKRRAGQKLYHQNISKEKN